MWEQFPVLVLCREEAKKERARISKRSCSSADSEAHIEGSTQFYL